MLVFYHNVFTLCSQELYKKEPEKIDAILQFRKKIEELENQFTVVLPDPLSLGLLDTNHHKIYQNRVEHWVWIFKNSKDPRVVDFRKRFPQVQDDDELTSLCSCIATLHGSLCYHIHTPNSRPLSNDNLLSIMKQSGILTRVILEVAAKIILRDLDIPHSRVLERWRMNP